MTPIKIPASYNYIGVFLTFRCNMNCNYCVNRFEKLAPVKELGSINWIEGLSRIETRKDLPLSLQGGEPTIHPYFYKIASVLHEHGKHMDLLTNGHFSVYTFAALLSPSVFKRKSKYANIRLSFHEKTDPLLLREKALKMQELGYSVGIWGLDYLGGQIRNVEMQKKCKAEGIDFRMKKFLGSGWEQNTYKYADACVCLGKRRVLCKPSELLINPSGHIFRCHADLYQNRGAIAHILDNKVKLPTKFLPCENYGWCNPCDVKWKHNRFQEWGHASVTIKGKHVQIGRKNKQ